MLALVNQIKSFSLAVVLPLYDLDVSMITSI